MLDLEIRALMTRYAREGGNWAVLEDQLEGASWASADAPADPMVETSLRILAEHANGDWTDAELADRLLHLAETYTLQVASVGVVGGSESAVILEDRQSASADRRLVAEPV
jgi:hypothetical protein